MARHDMRETQETRRERTRYLIELVGLVVKSGLVELTDDNCAVLYGAFLDMAGRLRSDDRAIMLARWQRKGRGAFGSESD